MALVYISYYYFGYRRQLQEAGDLLYEAGHNKLNFNTIIAIVMFTQAAMFFGLGQSVSLPFLVLGIANLIAGWQTLKVYEKGIFFFDHYWLWSEIQDYHWDVEKPDRLVIVLKKRGFRSFRKNIKRKVTYQDKSDLGQLFTQYLSN